MTDVRLMPGYEADDEGAGAVAEGFGRCQLLGLAGRLVLPG